VVGGQLLASRPPGRLERRTRRARLTGRAGDRPSSPSCPIPSRTSWPGSWSASSVRARHPQTSEDESAAPHRTV